MSKLTSILKESGLSRLVYHMEMHDCGTITAFRSKEGCGLPEDLPYALQDNKKRNAQLKAKLEMMGYGTTAVKGAYIENYGTPEAIEVREDVFFVVDLQDKGNLEADLRRLGEEYMQDSILFIPRGGRGSILIGTNHCSDYPGYGRTMQFNDRQMGKGGQFMTKVNGRPFIFEANLLEQIGNHNYYSVANNMGKWAMKTIANKDWKDIEI